MSSHAFSYMPFFFLYSIQGFNLILPFFQKSLNKSYYLWIELLYFDLIKIIYRWSNEWLRNFKHTCSTPECIIPECKCYLPLLSNSYQGLAQNQTSTGGLPSLPTWSAVPSNLRILWVSLLATSHCWTRGSPLPKFHHWECQ